MIVSHNIQSMNINRITNDNISLHGKSTEKVSSGYQINRAGDNPAGLAISEKMRRQVRGLKMGVENTKAAINFCKVADGALGEVTEMLQRLNELSVRSETGTNTLTDRHAIQDEVEQILAEIDRVADTTTFNEIPVFRGAEEVAVPGTDGSVIEGDIPFTDFTIADVSLGTAPFDHYSDANRLNLQAIVNNDSVANGRAYNLIFASGGTSRSSFRLTYQTDATDTETGDTETGDTNTETGGAETRTKTVTVQFSELTFAEYQTGEDSGETWWKRSFKYTDEEDGVEIKVTQKITANIPADPTQEKYYNISYSFANESTNKDVTLDFMFNADTAYNNNDICEGYFINDGSGKRLDKWSIFTNGGSWSGSDPIVPNDIANENIKPNLPESFSIIDVDQALAFSEKISFVSGSKPNALSVGPFSAVDRWSYYQDLENQLGGNTNRRDIAFSLFWNQNINSGASSDVSFNYGIIAYQKDNNLSGIEVTPSTTVIGPQRPHYGTKSLWIHSGNEAGSGLWLEIDEMDTEVLGIDHLDLTTQDGAAKANIRVKEALNQLSLNRGKIGAQQNRLEHTVFNEENIAEKVDASEASIRDTDLSSEMIQYSNLSILLKMGSAMIAESNQRIEKLMTILQ